MVGERVSVQSQVPGRDRRVVLQRKAGKRWVALARGRSKAGGRVVFPALSLRRSEVLRLVAPRARLKGRTLPAVTGRALRVAVARQSASLSMTDSLFVGEGERAVAVLSPARAGRSVALEALVGSVWTPLTVARSNGAGRAEFSLAGATVGSHSFRVVARSFRGAASRASTARQLRVLPAEVTVSPDVHELSPAQVQALASATPDGSSLSFTGADRPSLRTGDILSLLPSEVLPDGALVRVTGVVEAGESVTASTRRASIGEVVENVPPGFDQFPTTVLSTSVGELPDGVELDPPAPGRSAAGRTRAQRGAGVVVLNAPEQRYKIAWKHELNHVGYEVGGHVWFTPGLEFGYQAKLFQPADWHLGLRNVYDVKLEAKVSNELLDETFKQAMPLASTTFGISIARIVVPISVNTEMQLSLHLEEEVGLRASVSQSGIARYGVSRVDGVVDEWAADDSTVTAEPVTPYVAGKATLFYGFDGDIYAFGLAGLFTRLGVEAVAEAEVTPSGLTCGVSVGRVAESGSRASELLDQLFGLEEGFELAQDYPAIPLLGCGSDGANPVVTTTSLPDGQVGQPYAGLIETADGRDGVWLWAPGTVVPPGLDLDPSTGAVTGTPTQAGLFPVEVVFTDMLLRRTSRNLQVRIQAAEEFVLPWAYPAVPYVATLPSPVGRTGIWEVSGLPTGLVLEPRSGRITGVLRTGAARRTTLSYRFVPDDGVPGPTRQAVLRFASDPIGINSLCGIESSSSGRFVFLYGTDDPEAPTLPGKFVVNGVESVWGSGPGTTGPGWVRKKVVIMRPGQTYNAQMWAGGHQIAAYTNLSTAMPPGSGPCGNGDLLASVFPVEEEILGTE